MKPPGQILIIDDDRDFVVIYQEMLGALGLAVTVAHTPEEAVQVLKTLGSTLDVVLLDQKLQGPGGSNDGLELIAQVHSLAPFAKTIVVTAYAAHDAIERAFRLGVYDYLVKNGAFDALLRAKVRNAVEVTSERRLAALSNDEVVRELRETWDRVRTETDRNRKGVLLEELVRLLFRATPGFERVETRVQNELEEIDIVVENRSEDPIWVKDGSPYVLGECKNWSSKCGPQEYSSFHRKLTTKYGRATTGFFFAVGGFTDAFHAQRAADKTSATNALVIPVDATDLDRWIAADDRLAVLTELYKRAVFDKAR
jgi:ActR/RegA family two-component response regulator